MKIIPRNMVSGITIRRLVLACLSSTPERYEPWCCCGDGIACTTGELGEKRFFLETCGVWEIGTALDTDFL